MERTLWQNNPFTKFILCLANTGSKGEILVVSICTSLSCPTSSSFFSFHILLQLIFACRWDLFPWNIINQGSTPRRYHSSASSVSSIPALITSSCCGCLSQLINMGYDPSFVVYFIDHLWTKEVMIIIYKFGS